MVRGTLTLAAGALTLAALMAPVGGAQAVQNGGRISTRTATPGAVDFTPPLVFAYTLPLQGFYLNAKTGMRFVGTGAVLDSASPSFSGVTGLPPGGFLAFDCHSHNVDGSVPKLPLGIRFSRPVAGVSMNVGSLASAGATVTMTAFDSKGRTVAQGSIVAAPAVEPITVVVATRKIASVTLTGPCNLAVEDIFDSDAE